MGNYFKNELVTPETKVLEDQRKEKPLNVQQGCGNSVKHLNLGNII